VLWYSVVSSCIFSYGKEEGGKSYGGQVDVQTVFDQAILVAESDHSHPEKIQIISFRRRPPASTPPSSSGRTQAA
jgi:hypothetical protein